MDRLVSGGVETFLRLINRYVPGLGIATESIMPPSPPPLPRRLLLPVY